MTFYALQKLRKLCHLIYIYDILRLTETTQTLPPHIYMTFYALPKLHKLCHLIYIYIRHSTPYRNYTNSATSYIYIYDILRLTETTQTLSPHIYIYSILRLTETAQTLPPHIQQNKYTDSNVINTTQLIDKVTNLNSHTGSHTDLCFLRKGHSQNIFQDMLITFSNLFCIIYLV